MYGSRGSGKSYFASELILDRVLTWKNYTCVCIRKEVSKNADSTFKLLVKTIQSKRLSSLFKITNSPNMRIKCINGNEILFRGMDGIDNIKSLVNISNLYFEEEIPDSENDFETVALTMRGISAKFLQIIYTINPTIQDHQNHWFYKRWFLDEKGNEEVDLSFKKSYSIEFDGEIIEEKATISHSSYLNNRWLDKGTFNALQLLKLKDPYTYATQGLGRWSAKVPGGRFWKLFDLQRNSVHNNPYNPDLPIHLSFDFNKNPGMHVGIYQVDGYTVRQIDEIALRSPNNRTTDACQTFIRRYSEHSSGLYIYGDPNGYKEDSSTEKGYNNFAIIFELLKMYKPGNRTIRKAPPVAKSADWINEIFFSKLNGIDIIIPESCKESIADMIYTQEMPDGTVFKPKVKTDKDESAYEKWGHFSDLLRYFMVSCFSKQFESYKLPGKKEIIMGTRVFKEDW